MVRRATTARQQTASAETGAIWTLEGRRGVSSSLARFWPLAYGVAWRRLILPDMGPLVWPSVSSVLGARSTCVWGLFATTIARIRTHRGGCRHLGRRQRSGPHDRLRASPLGFIVSIRQPKSTARNLIHILRADFCCCCCWRQWQWCWPRANGKSER